MKPYYEDGQATIYHGDCLEIIPDLPTADLVIADPPYSLGVSSDLRGKVNPWADACNSSLWFAAWFSAVRKRLRQSGAMWAFLSWRSLVTYQKAACDIRWPIESMLVWDKQWIGPGGSRGLRPSYEMVALLGMPGFALRDRGLPDIRRCQWSSHKPNLHPAEKPTDLLAWLVGESVESEGLVLDPFVGSGSTLIAARDMGCRAIGIEHDEAWCEVAADRCRQSVLTLQCSGSPA